MKELGKVSSKLIYQIWRNISLCLIGMMLITVLNILLPYYLSPIWGLTFAVILYTFIYENRGKKNSSCFLIPFSFLYVFVGYSFAAILINILYAWGFRDIPNELLFFNRPPFLSCLILYPVGFIVMLFVYLRHRRMNICQDCRRNSGELFERGNQGNILDNESKLQLRNVTVVFGLISIAVWFYYVKYFVNVNISGRDWYVFAISILIILSLDIAYFGIRYYNLYLDLEENGELLSSSDINNIGGKTYLRFYVICGNQVYVDPDTIDPQSPWKEVIDTPFFTKRSVNGINIIEIRKTISQMTGRDGELRFFYGRKLGDSTNNSIIRYFYFLDCEEKECPHLSTEGEWMDFDKIKYLYSTNPGRLGDIMIKDITRLATIILTEKVFNEKGYRKSKIKLYKPTFDMSDVRRSNLDFQDEKWINISMFNSDTPFYGIKRRLRSLVGSRKRKNKNSWS